MINQQSMFYAIFFYAINNQNYYIILKGPVTVSASEALHM